MVHYWPLFPSRNLRWNKLQDAIPPEIGELKSLTHLWVTLTFLISLHISYVFFFDPWSGAFFPFPPFFFLPFFDWEKKKREEEREESSRSNTGRKQKKKILNQRLEESKKKKRKKIPDQRSEENKTNIQKGLWTRHYLNNTELS